MRGNDEKRHERLEFVRPLIVLLILIARFLGLRTSPLVYSRPVGITTPALCLRSHSPHSSTTNVHLKVSSSQEISTAGLRVDFARLRHETLARQVNTHSLGHRTSKSRRTLLTIFQIALRFPNISVWLSVNKTEAL